MLDQVDTVVAQHLAGTNCDRLVPRLIDVDPHAGAVAQGVLDGDDVGQILVHFTGADLQFENPVAADIEHFFGFGDIAGGVATGQGPGHL